MKITREFFRSADENGIWFRHGLYMEILVACKPHALMRLTDRRWRYGMHEVRSKPRNGTPYSYMRQNRSTGWYCMERESDPCWREIEELEQKSQHALSAEAAEEIYFRYYPADYGWAVPPPQEPQVAQI